MLVSVLYNCWCTCTLISFIWQLYILNVLHELAELAMRVMLTFCIQKYNIDCVSFYTVIAINILFFLEKNSLVWDGSNLIY